MAREPCGVPAEWYLGICRPLKRACNLGPTSKNPRLKPGATISSRLRRHWPGRRPPRRRRPGHAHRRQAGRHHRRAGNPLDDIKVMERVAFVMKDGVVVRDDTRVRAIATRAK